jgi:hypothetical protein
LLRFEAIQRIAEGVMKALLVGLLFLTTLGCEISPVVSAPEQEGSRYRDCERAARDYCKHSIKAGEDEMKACVAEHLFRCVSAGARPLPPHRS